MNRRTFLEGLVLLQETGNLPPVELLEPERTEDGKIIVLMPGFRFPAHREGSVFEITSERLVLAGSQRFGQNYLIEIGGIDYGGDTNGGGGWIYRIIFGDYVFVPGLPASQLRVSAGTVIEWRRANR